MSIEVFTYTGTMEIHECPTCAMAYAAPIDYFRRKNETSGSWHCPEGHSVHFTKSQKQKMADLEADLARQRARTRHAEDQYEAAQASARAYKGHNTRIRNRIKNGVCPFCNRSFANVREHMASVHGDGGVS